MRIFLPLALSLAFFLGSLTAGAQSWTKAEEVAPNYFTIRQQFLDHWADKTPTKGSGWKVFKRWEWHWQDRILPDGSFPPANINQTEWKKYAATHTAVAAEMATSNWTSMGPNSSSSGYSGIGRINCLAFHPTNTSIIWAGAPAGGLWKTTNGGASWSPQTDNLAVLGVSAIVVDPTNANTLYMATGDCDGRDTYSTGVLKSTDGGSTWTTTGLSFSITQFRVIYRLIIHPTNPAILLASTSDGLYRTINSGANWTKVNTDYSYDVQFKPGTPATVYAASENILYLSTDTGATWTAVLTIANSDRLAISVSAANTSFVAAVSSSGASGAFGSFNGLYTSSNSGASYTLKSSTPNILGGNSDGSGSTGQGWYDLCISVSPTNANTIFVGGVNLWKSTNGGTSWTLATHWYNISGVPTVHADKHYLAWQNTTTLFNGNDGGIYKTTNNGTSWTDISNTLVISQLYSLGVSQSDDKVIIGLQDNGTKVRSTAGSWSDHIGGDGFECIIHPTNSSIMYGELYYGEIQRTTNGGTSWTDIQNNIPGQPSGAWLTPYVMSPTSSTTLLAGYQNVYRTTNQGTSWTAISTNLTGGDDLRRLAIAPSNTNTIYASENNAIYRTTNGGTSWSNITGTLPVGSANISYISVDPADANRIYVTLGNYASGQKVYRSTNGGSTWTNFSGSLPNLPANCIVYQSGSNEGLYVGMDVGVYYRNATMSDWVAFNTNLPNMPVTELEIRQSTGKIRAATYGRGLWESNVEPPSSNFLTVTPANQDVGAAAGSTPFAVSSNVTWTATDNQAWLTLAPAGGTGNGTITATFTANTGTSSRVATVTVTGGSLTQTVTVTQAGTGGGGGCTDDNEPANNSTATAPTISVGVPKLSQIGTNGDVDHWKFSVASTMNTTLNLTTLPADYDLQLLNSSGAVLGTSEQGGTANETITQTLAAGTYYAKVYGFNGAFSNTLCYTLQVDITAASFLTVTPANQNVSDLAGNTSFAIASNVSWTSTDDQTWLSLSTSSGTGNGSLTATFTANTSTAARVATITVSGGSITQTVTVTQAGVPPPTCLDDSEPANNTLATAPVLAFNTDKKSQIGSTIDMDHWKFTTSTNQVVILRLTQLPLDYDLSLLSATGAVLATSANAGTTNEFIEVLVPAGTYYAQVFGYNGAFSLSDCYTLRISSMILGICTNSNEPANNTLAGAPVRPLNSYTFSQIGTSTDVDYWKFTLTGAGTITLDLFNHAVNYDLELLNSAGQVLAASTNTGNARESITFSAAAGTYSARVKGVGGAFSTSVCYVLEIANTDWLFLTDPGGDDREEIPAIAFEALEDVAILPNPTTGLVTVRLGEPAEARVKIYDPLGRLVISQQLDTETTLDLSAQPPGLYQVHILPAGRPAIVRQLLVIRG